MDVAWKEDQHSWRVVISDGVMRIGGFRYDQGSGRWVVEVDVAIRPEDVLSVKFKTIDDSPIFPSDYYLDMKYRNPRDGSKLKIRWPLRFPDEETLGALLGGLEGFIESSTQQNVSGHQMRKLTKYASQAEEDARQAADERRRDESFEARQGDISNMAKRGRLDELGCDEQKLSALLPGTSFYSWITLVKVLAAFLMVCFAFLALQDWIDLHSFIAEIIVLMMACALLLVQKWLVERSKKFT